MNSQLVSGLFALVILGAVGSCKSSGDGYESDEALAGPRFTGAWVYDTGTLCAAGDVTMHCCPPGMALIGAHVGDNVFKCAQLVGSHDNHPPGVDTPRAGMHACPPGEIMVGLHVITNQLACQAVHPGLTVEHVTGRPGTVDSYPMHVCPPGAAMIGIHVTDNTITCER